MQPFNHSQLANRSGITIIEVLTAMVVAMIGVFGIMALIPFAIRQAETGLDFDDANRIARNAVEQFEIGGHDRLLDTLVDTDGDNVPDTSILLPPWYALDSDDNVVRVGSPSMGGPPPTPPGVDVYVIDPLSIGYKAQFLPPVDPDPPAYGQFPPLSSIIAANYPPEQPPVTPPNTPPPNAFPRFPEANLGSYDPTIDPDPNGPTYPTLSEMTYSEAVRMFLATDDLEYGNFDFDATGMANNAPSVPSSDLLPPRMYFDQDGGDIRRQSRGEISWQMMLVPVKDDYNSTTYPTGGSGNWKFRQFTLVYENRVLNSRLYSIGESPEMIMRIARVTAWPNTFKNNGGTITLDKTVDDVRKNDWIMMVNRDVSGMSESGFEKQVGFYRVVDTNGVNKITLDGPDFDFGSPGERTTYVVHLVNYDGPKFLAVAPQFDRLGRVVNVYERTFRLKGSSSWNN